MKKFLLILFATCIMIPEANALKSYSYDADGNRVYQTVSGRYSTPDGYKYSRTPKGNLVVHDRYGNRLKTQQQYKKTYVYDGNGKRIRTYKMTPDGKTHIYNENGERIMVYKYGKNGNSYLSEIPYGRAFYNSGNKRTFVTTNSRSYSHQFKGTGGSFSSRPTGRGGTRIVATTGALYRYGR